MATNPFAELVNCSVPHCEAEWCNPARKRICALLYYYELIQKEIAQELADERLSEESKDIIQKNQKK
jgi:hypothetical protein